MGRMGNSAVLLDTAAAAIGPTALAPFQVWGSIIAIDVEMSDAGCGTLTITAEIQKDPTTGYTAVVDGNAAADWTSTVVNVAGAYRLALPGLQVADGDWLRLSYGLTAGVGTIRITAESFYGDSADLAGAAL